MKHDSSQAYEEHRLKATAISDAAPKIESFEPNLSAWGAAAKALASTPEFALLNRYQSRLQAAYQRAFNNLIRTRKAILRTEPETGLQPATGVWRGAATRGCRAGTLPGAFAATEPVCRRNRHQL